MSDRKIRGYTVAQTPNPPLVAAFIGGVVSLISSDGSLVHGVARAVFIVGLAIWAYGELTEGVNGFRRALGAAGLAIVLVSLVSSFS
ncbi:MAG: hypothetical protein JJE10_00895 [Thermoleophilia bacterium]|nr:hypothetical protein [Thermoleophilia bacterium]